MQIVMQKNVIYVILSLWEAGIKAWEASKLKRPKEKQNWIEGTAFCLVIKKWSLRKMNLLKLGRTIFSSLLPTMLMFRFVYVWIGV